MARIEESVEIRLPVERVFAYVTDVKNLPKWISSMLEAEQTSPGQMAVGATFRGVNQMMGQRMAWTSKVTEYESNKKTHEAISSGSTLIEENMTFESVEGGTKFTFADDIKVGGLLKLFAPMMTSMMRKQTRGNLNELKHILETQT